MTYCQPLDASLIYREWAMDAKEAGKIMQGHRNRLKLTQDEVAAQTGVPSAQYLSALENGRYDVRNSEHFQALVTLYRLDADQVREVNPSAVIEVAATEHHPASAAANGYRNIPKRTVEIPDALKEAAELYGHLPAFSGLAETRWLNFMAGGVRRQHTPQDVEGWLREFSDLKRMGYDPQEDE